MAKPISPTEVASAKLKNFPDAVIDTWNRMIASKWNGTSALIHQDQIVNLLAAANGVERHIVFDSGWLDIEEIYRKEGWSIYYDKPGYNESYEPSFEFKKKK